MKTDQKIITTLLLVITMIITNIEHPIASLKAATKPPSIQTTSKEIPIQIRDIEIDASDLKNDSVFLKNDTFNRITIKNDVASSNINFNGVTVKDAIIIEGDSNFRLSLSASNINRIDVKGTDNSNFTTEEKETTTPSITLSKKTKVTELNLKRDIAVSADHTSILKTLKVLPDSNQHLNLSLTGCSGNIVLNGIKDSSVTAILDNCTIKLADIASDHQPIKVNFKNKEISAPNSKIVKIQSTRLARLDTGISSDLIILDQEPIQSAAINNSPSPINNINLTIRDKAVIKKIINNLNYSDVAVESGTVNDYIINSNVTTAIVNTKEAIIDKITANGDYSTISGIGRTSYIKLNGNNSNVSVINTKIETGSNTYGNYAGTTLLNSNDTFITNSKNMPQIQVNYVNSGWFSAPSMIRLAAPSNFKTAWKDDIYSFSWDAVTSATKYLISIYNKTSGNKMMEQYTAAPEYAAFLPVSGSAIQINIKAIGDGVRYSDSYTAVFDINDEDIPIPSISPTPTISPSPADSPIPTITPSPTASSAPTVLPSPTALPSAAVVIKDCNLENVVSKKTASTESDMNYRLSLQLNWTTTGSTPDSYHIYIKNIISNTIQSVTAAKNSNSLRLNQYITMPDTTYEITVVPVSGGSEGSSSNVYTYTSPSSGCGDSDHGCFLWKDTDSYGKPVYGITTTEQMEHIKTHYNSTTTLDNYVVLVQLNDIDFGGKTYQDSIAGNLRMPGTIYDGQGFMVDHFTVHISSGIGGVFAYVGLNNATIKDFGIGKQAAIVSTGNNDSVGSIAGELYGTLSRSYSYAAVQANSTKQVGGLIGQNAHGIKNSYFAGSVTNTGSGPTGGIVGIANNFVINSYNIGSVTGNGSTGGIAGNVTRYPVNSCYNLNYPLGPVSQTGGLAGITVIPMVKGFMVSSDNAEVIAGTPSMNGTSQKISTAQFQTPQVISYLDSSNFIYNPDNRRPEIIDNRERY